jgi:sugar lactone lactonase YvrE
MSSYYYLVLNSRKIKKNKFCFFLLVSALVAIMTLQPVLATGPLLSRILSFAGNSYSAVLDGVNGVGSFSSPWGFEKAPSGKIYVANNHVITEVDDSLTLRIFAGSDAFGNVNSSRLLSQFYEPRFVTFNANGDMFISDTRNHQIKKIDMNTGEVSLFAGSTQGSADGLGALAQFNFPAGLDFDSAGNLYVADSGNRKLRKIDITGLVSTIALHDNASSVYDGGAFATKIGNDLGDLEVFNNEIYFVDSTYKLVRKFNTLSSSLVRVAGTSVSGDSVGNALTGTTFSYPRGIAIDSTGNVYISDSGNNNIKFLDSGNSTVSLVTSSNTLGHSDGNLANARIDNPFDIDLISDNELLFLDRNNHVLKLLDTQSFTVKEISTLAGRNRYDDKNGAFGVNSFRRPFGTARDSSGNIYITDYDNNKIRKLDTAGNLTTLAGPAQGSRVAGFTDANANAATFNGPADIVVDSIGNLFIADSKNHCIRKIDISGNVTTFAGGAGVSGYLDDLGVAARFKTPLGLAIDSSDNLYVSDAENRRIRKIDIAGNVTTFAGTGSAGLINGPAILATFDQPVGLSFDNIGNLVIADRYNHAIRKITIDGINNLVTTVAGGTGFGFQDGNVSQATFNQPHDVAVDSSGVIYVADRYNHVVRRISTSGQVDTIAGSGTKGFLDANFSKAAFNEVISLLLSNNKLIVSDFINNRLRELDLNAVAPVAVTVDDRAIFTGENLYVSTYAGSNAGYLDAPRGTSRFNNPTGIAKDSLGNIYVVDRANHRIRKIDSNGLVTTFAGSVAGNADGPALAAQFRNPTDIAIDLSNNLYIADTDNNVIKKISGGLVTTVVVGLNRPQGLTFNNSGKLLIADTNNHKIKLYDGVNPPADFAGVGAGFKNGIALTQARFNAPTGIVVDANNNVFVADSSNQCIRQISPSGFVTTYAGVGTSSFGDGDAQSALFFTPGYLAIDAAGNLLVTDRNNNRVRRIRASDKKVFTLAGNGARGFAEGAVNKASFGYLGGILALASGEIFVADINNSRIRLISNLDKFNANQGVVPPTPPTPVTPAAPNPSSPSVLNSKPVIRLINRIDFDSENKFSVLSGTSLTLRAFIFDAEDSSENLLPSVKWESSVDGVLAEGTADFNIENLSLGLHTISMSVRDSNNASGSFTYKINIVENDGTGSVDPSLLFNDSANIVNITAPSKLSFPRAAKKPKLKATAFQLNTVDNVSTVQANLTNQVTWERISFADKDSADAAERTFIKTGGTLQLSTLPKGIHAVFARVGESEDYLKVTVSNNRIEVETVSNSQNFLLTKKN